MFNKTFATLAVAAFILSPVAAVAGENAVKPNYAAKKQGRVHFETTTEDTVNAAQDATSPEAAADIEPAAGAVDVPEEDEAGSLAQEMKLPRKN